MSPLFIRVHQRLFFARYTHKDMPVMTHITPETQPQQQPIHRQGLPVRSNLRAGVVLQIDIPSITTVQQEAQTPVEAATV